MRISCHILVALHFFLLAAAIPLPAPAREELPAALHLIARGDGQVLAITDEQGGLFLSTDGGRKWQTPASPPAGYPQVASVAGKHVFLSTSGGLFAADSQGLEWRAIAPLPMTLLAWQQRHPLYARIGNQGLFRSENVPDASALMASLAQGKLVQLEGLPDAPVQALAFEGESSVFAAYFGRGIWRSRDEGKTWQEVAEGLANPFVLALARDESGTIWAGTYGSGLFHWAPREEAWQHTGGDASDGIVQSLSFGPGGMGLAVLRDAGLLLSRDNGGNWRIITGPDERITTATIDGQGHIYCAGRGHHVYRSRDLGQTWQKRTFSTHILHTTADQAGNWFVLVRGVGVLRSSDQGATWQTVAVPPPLHPAGQDTALVARGNRLFLADRDNGPHVSEDAGESWTPLFAGLPVERGIGAFATHGHDRLYAFHRDGQQFYRLDESTDRWQPIRADEEHGDKYSAWNMFFDSDGEAIVYGYNDILLSSGHQSAWRRHRFGQAYRAVWLDADARVWTERMMSTFRLSDDGTDWEKPDAAPAARYTSLQPMPNGHFAAINLDGGVSILLHEDRKLEQIARGLPGTTVLSLTVTSDGAILAGTERGLWISRDAGNNWTETDFHP